MAELDTSIRMLGGLMGEVLESYFPRNGLFVPHESVEPIADAMQAIIAEALQAWIDAGSEREVTMENEQLREALVAEVFGWSDHPDNGPVKANGDNDTD